MEEKLPSSTVGHRGRIAVVTGAARGLGRAIAQGLAGAGAVVVGVDLLDLEETGQLVSKSGAGWLPIQADISSETQVEVIANQVLGRFGRCDNAIGLSRRSLRRNPCPYRPTSSQPHRDRHHLRRPPDA